MQFSWSLNPSAGSTPTFDLKLASLSVLLWIALMPVFSIAHEYGHAFICMYNNMPYNIEVGLFGASVACTGVFDDPTPFRMAGGYLASGIALITAVAVRKLVPVEKSFLYIPLMAIGVTQFGQMIMESAFNQFYMTSNLATVIPTMVALITLIVLLKKKSAELEDKKMRKVIESNQRKNQPQQIVVDNRDYLDEELADLPELEETTPEDYAKDPEEITFADAVNDDDEDPKGGFVQ